MRSVLSWGCAETKAFIWLGMFVECSTSDIYGGRNFSSEFTHWKGNFHLMEEMKNANSFAIEGGKRKFWVSKLQNVKDTKIFRKFWKAMEAWTSPALHNSTRLQCFKWQAEEHFLSTFPFSWHKKLSKWKCVMNLPKIKFVRSYNMPSMKWYLSKIHSSTSYSRLIACKNVIYCIGFDQFNNGWLSLWLKWTIVPIYLCCVIWAA